MIVALIISLIISIMLNMYLYFQLKRYHVNDNTYKAKWQEVMGLNNPLNIILWTILISGILIGLIAALSGLIQLTVA
ncbi:hypothetical protein LIT25_11260 [Bacillus sp. F19]|nr:hypothetical protein LIT25_11260 [Bacillus sp. F19]